MRRGRWFLLGIGVGVMGTRRLRALAHPMLERSLERTARHAVARMRGDLRVALREAIAAYRDEPSRDRKTRVLEGEVREIHGL